MQKTVLSERMYKILTEHVAEIEREKEPIIKAFYAESAEMGMDSEAFFREYTAEVEKHLRNIKAKKEGPDECPFTIIGSRVQLRDAEYNETFSYSIVLPFAGKSVLSLESASCLSPIGRALLLKPAGASVTVKTPAGQINYEIMNISITEENTESGAGIMFNASGAELAL